MTLLEVVIAAGVLAVMLPATYYIFSQVRRNYASTRGASAIDQVEEELKTFVLSFMKAYVQCSALQCAAEQCPVFPPDDPSVRLACNALPAGVPVPPVPPGPGCYTQTTSFLKRWGAVPAAAGQAPPNVVLPSGTMLQLIKDANDFIFMSNGRDISSDPGDPNADAFRKAKARCLGPTVAKGESAGGTSGVYPDLSNLVGGVYFCLRLTSVGARPQGASDLSAMQPVIGEFRYSTVNLSTMKAIKCIDLSEVPNPNPLFPPEKQVGLLYFTLYWRIADAGGAVWKQYTTSYISGGN